MCIIDSVIARYKPIPCLIVRKWCGGPANGLKGVLLDNLWYIMPMHLNRKQELALWGVWGLITAVLWDRSGGWFFTYHATLSPVPLVVYPLLGLGFLLVISLRTRQH